MSQQPRENPQLPDHINNRNEHPLKDFLILAVAALLLISLLTWLVAASATWLAPNIPYQWEFSGTNSNSNLSAEEQALTSLLDKLLDDDALPVQLHYLADETSANAFATLGGHIFITRGLLENIHSENGLAMVLAHEYAHIELRHPMTLALEQLSIGLLLSLMGSDNLAQSVSQNTSMLTVLSFSRDMERAADRFALQRLQAVYGHTRGADEFFNQIQQLEQQHSATDSGWLEFLQTHPLTSTRINNIRQQMSGGELTPIAHVLQKRSAEP